LQNQSIKTYDICIAADWEYDADFLGLIEKYALELGLTTLLVTENNLRNTIFKIENGKLQFRYLFDRASDTNPAFRILNDIFIEQKIPIFDSLLQLFWASDKATMHLEFIENGLQTPFTIILPSYKNVEKIQLSIHDLASLGRPFIIKPANTTGGGIGVVDGAETLQDVLKARVEFKNDKYLLQKKIIPIERENRRFWFRGFYACELIRFTWWNDLTHISHILTEQEIDYFELSEMFNILIKIADISKLNFFSTEIALNELNQLVVVDYVNESCDMRLKSKHYDGVPDLIVENIANSIIKYLYSYISGIKKKD
jgi:hypothetical protein